jgi:hypothetical protein
MEATSGVELGLRKGVSPAYHETEFMGDCGTGWAICDDKLTGFDRLELGH